MASDRDYESLRRALDYAIREWDASVAECDRLRRRIELHRQGSSHFGPTEWDLWLWKEVTDGQNAT